MVQKLKWLSSFGTQVEWKRYEAVKNMTIYLDILIVITDKFCHIHWQLKADTNTDAEQVGYTQWPCTVTSAKEGMFYTAFVCLLTG